MVVNDQLTGKVINEPLKKRFRILPIGLALLAYFLLCISFTTRNSSFVIAADLIVYILVLCNKPEDDFLLYAFLTPVTSLLPSSIFRFYICLIISIIKILFKTRLEFSYLTILSILLFSANFIILDFLIGNDSSVMTLLFIMFYMIIVIDKKIITKVNPQHLAWTLLISALLIITAMFVISGRSLNDYANSANIQFRVGEETRSLGGAMGISLYGCISICCIYYLITTGRGILKTIFLLACGTYLSIIELFSVSRTFFVTLCALFILVLITNFHNRKMFFRLIICLIAILILILGAYHFYSNEIHAMTSKLVLYLGDATSSERPKIWTSCFEYQLLHPISAIFGGGTSAYMWNQQAYSYDFYRYGAHDLYLDAFMSFGIVGTIFLILIYLQAYIICKKNCNLDSKNRLQKIEVAVPFIVFSISQLFQGSFRDIPSYIIPIAMIILVQSNKITVQSINTTENFSERILES